MGLFDWITGQFIDVIAWTDDSHDTMVWRFPREGNEIKYGAKLIVREGQTAVFVNEGEIADILGPGTYELETGNLPVLTTMQHWDHGFKSPFKAEVYFLNMTRFTDLKWGTRNPITVRDPEFAMVRLRAFGSYEIRIEDPRTFMQEVVGTDGHFTLDEIQSQLANLIVSKLAVVLGQDRTPALDLAANYEAFGRFITEGIAPAFREYGLKLERILVENISLPEAVEKAIDARGSRAAAGNLDEHLKYRSAEALDKGGSLSDMAGMGVGFAMAQEMARGFGPSGQNAPVAPSDATPPPPPPPQQKLYYVSTNGDSEGPYPLEQLRQMVGQGRLTPGSYLWSEGFDGWKAAKAALPQLFETTTPPPPPPPQNS